MSEDDITVTYFSDADVARKIRDNTYKDVNETAKYMYAQPYRPTGPSTEFSDEVLDLSKLINLSSIDSARLDYQIQIDGSCNWKFRVKEKIEEEDIQRFRLIRDIDS